MANLPPFNLDERSRLLSSMYYSGENVVAEFHRFAGESSSLTKSDRSADAVLADQERFLTLTPSLLRALKLIGVDKNDVKGDFARDIGQAVERMVLQWTGDEGTAARAARNAENLSIFASNANAVRTVNVPDTSYVSETLDRRSDAAQLYGLDPALLDRPLDAIRAIRLKAQNSKEYLSPSAAALEWLGALCRAGLLHEANVAYTAFAKQYPRNANYVASIVPAKVLNHYWMSHLDHHGVQRSRVWQTEHPTWVDEGVQALHGGRLEKWAAQALDQIRMTRL
ncbi:Uncharacterised protein [Pandoraea pulmonicola]|nr:Uncharacterised protein [Pandoraea pulmonicola]